MPLTSHAHRKLKHDPTIKYLEDSKQEVIVTDKQMSYKGILTSDFGMVQFAVSEINNVAFSKEVGPDIYSIVTHLDRVKNFSLLTTPQQKQLFKSLSILGDAISQITNQGILLGNTTYLDKMMSELKVLYQDQSIQSQNYQENIRKVQAIYQSIINRNDTNIAHYYNAQIRQNAVGAIIITFITAAIGTGIYFGYRKLSSKSDKEQVPAEPQPAAH